MDVGNNEGARKRTVDADNQNEEIADPKRPRINLDKTIKDSVLKYIIASGMKLFVHLGYDSEPFLSNLTIGHQIMSIMQGAHNIMRKMANNRATTHPSLALSANISSLRGDKPITYQEVIDLMKPTALAYGLQYDASNRSDNKHWYGIANPIFNILSAFKMRYDEIRIGVSRIPVGKRGNTTDYVDVSQYGLTPAHHVLLEGSTYKPERRSAMAQTLGPITAILAAYKARDPYRAKWVEAVKRDLVHVPNALNLCTAMYGKRSEEVAPALNAFADVVLIAGARNAQRAFFPLNFLIFSFSKEITEPEVAIEAAKMKIEMLDFSGKGMWLLYKECMGHAWILETAMDDVSAGQVVYHSVFGTQNEDLGVLQSVTDSKSPWKLRSDIADRFRSAGKAETVIKLPKQVLYAKMAQANMTGLLTESAFQIRCKQVFAGKRTVNYIDAFYKHMNSDAPQAIQGGMTLHALAAFYRSLKLELMNKKDDHPIQGTVEWRSISGLSNTHHGLVYGGNIRETGRYFCGRS